MSPEGLDIQIKVRFFSDDYKIGLSAIIDNGSNKSFDNNLSLSLSHFPLSTKRGYGVFEGMGLYSNGSLEQIDLKNKG